MFFLFTTKSVRINSQQLAQIIKGALASIGHEHVDFDIVEGGPLTTSVRKGVASTNSLPTVYVNGFASIDPEKQSLFKEKIVKSIDEANVHEGVKVQIQFLT